MKKVNTIIVCLSLVTSAVADEDYKVATVISATLLEEAAKTAPLDRVSDQPLTHVESAEGRLGIGVIHRPVMETAGLISAIQHHKQSEVYRVMAGSGTLVTGSHMENAKPIDPNGYTVKHLTGPSDMGTIQNTEASQLISAGDMVIIPAGVAHGFSEITEPITYMVVRVDPERLVALK